MCISKISICTYPIFFISWYDWREHWWVNTGLVSNNRLTALWNLHLPYLLQHRVVSGHDNPHHIGKSLISKLLYSSTLGPAKCIVVVPKEPNKKRWLTSFAWPILSKVYKTYFKIFVEVHKHKSTVTIQNHKYKR